MTRPKKEIIERNKRLFEEGVKFCPKCTAIKKIEEFRRQGYCKPCTMQYSKDRWADEDQREKEKQNGAFYRKNNSLKEKSRKLKYNQEHVEKISTYKRIYNQTHKTENAAYERKRTQENVNYRFAKNLRSNHNRIFKGQKKINSAVRDLGCSIEFFQQHIINQFTEGMTLENYGNREGQWSLDHIYPLSKVDINNIEQIKMVTHYTNLRPMWHIDNVKKSNKIT
jgi:hypothetical protein